MSDTVYCYHCSRYHPREEMRQVESKGRKRWRCAASIEAAKQSRSDREAYGRAMTERNRSYWSQRAKARHAAAIHDLCEPVVA